MEKEVCKPVSLKWVKYIKEQKNTHIILSLFPTKKSRNNLGEFKKRFAASSGFVSKTILTKHSATKL
jgi:hypothetical protein